MKYASALPIILMLAACNPKEEPKPEPLGPISEVEIVSPLCPPKGYDRASVLALKEAGFELTDASERQAFAINIVECLNNPDPVLRDGVAYRALAHMLREKQLAPETLHALTTGLQGKLEAEDPDGFGQPFAALALSEVARADRIEAFLSEEELLQLLVKAQHYMINVRDYRGFSESEGWRHGVAHGADLLMQLALNERIDREGLELVRDAVAVQVAPKGHAYVFGESERLTQTVLAMATRGAFSEKQWTAWLKEVCGPGELESWDRAFASEEGLARLHDVRAFLGALYLNAKLGSDEKDDALLKGVEAALKALP